MSRNTISRLILNFSSTLLLISTLAFFVPLYIYYTNTIEFAATGRTISIALGIITIVLTTIVSLLTLLLPKRYDPVVISLFVSTSLAIWLQSYILPGKYGVLDGQTIDWQQHIYEGVLDSFIWIAILVICFKFFKTIFKHATNLIIALLVIQSISLATSYYYAPPEALYKDFTIDESTKFTFSKKENIIIIVLDTFQSNYFTEIVTQHPDYLKAFKGFTYFPDTLGGFPTTYPSIPLILTGKYYDNSQPIRTFIQTTFNQADSLLHQIKKNGYKIEMYPFLPQTIDFSSRIISNAKIDHFNTEKITKVIQSLWQISTFRASPTIIKYTANQKKIAQSLFQSTGELPKDVNDSRQNITFVQKLKDSIEITDSQPTFKFYHLPGAHTPFLIDENLNYRPMPNTSQSYSRITEGLIKLTADLLHTLEEEGVYNNSTIIIVSDHGLGMPVSLEQSSIPNYVLGSGLPLLLIKPAQATGEFSTSTQPVTLATIAPMIKAGLKTSMRTLLDQPKDLSPTPRHFYHYSWNNGGGFLNANEYLPTMREYIINGPAFDPKSWQKTDNILNAQNTITKVNIPTYELGQKLTFDYTDTANDYKAEGWSQAEINATWTDGKQASLNFPNLPADKDLVLEVHAKPFIYPPKLPKQIVEVFCNDHHIATWQADKKTTYQATIPHQCLKPNSRITFKLPNSIAPCEISTNSDGRQLGIAVSSVVIKEPTTYQIGEVLNFTTTSPSDAIKLESGWSVAEIHGTWSIGKEAHLSFALSESDKNKRLELVLEAQPYTTTEIQEQIVKIYANGQYVNTVHMNHQDTINLPLPLESIQNNKLQIKLELPNAVAPNQVSASSDDRVLGIYLSSAQLIFSK